MKRGKFIVFEGLDGSGSTTQTRLAADYLRIQNLNVLETKEPTNNAIGGLVRAVLSRQLGFKRDFGDQDLYFPRYGLQLLFSADRAHHLWWEIEPALEKGKWVVCDRYIYSTLVYGSVDCDYETLRKINDPFLVPHMVFYMVLDPNNSMKRVERRGGEKEIFEKIEFQKKVLANYEREWATRKDLNLVRLDAAMKPNEISDVVNSYLGKMIE